MMYFGPLPLIPSLALSKEDASFGIAPKQPRRVTKFSDVPSAFPAQEHNPSIHNSFLVPPGPQCLRGLS